MGKLHFLRYMSDIQDIRCSVSKDISCTKVTLFPSQQNNLFYFPKDSLFDGKRYAFTKQNNLFYFSARQL